MYRNQDPHVHQHEEQRHREHAERREQARAGDGTIEQEEAQLSAIRAIAYRRENQRLQDALRDAVEQLAEVKK